MRAFGLQPDCREETPVASPDESADKKQDATADLITAALRYLEVACTGFERRWNSKHDRFNDTPKATKLWVRDDHLIVGDGTGRTHAVKYPEHLTIFLKACERLTKDGAAAHSLATDGATVIGKPPHQSCVPIMGAIKERLQKE